MQEHLISTTALGLWILLTLSLLSVHLIMHQQLAGLVAFTTILTPLRASTQALISILLSRSLLTSTEHLFLLQVSPLSPLLMEVRLTVLLTELLTLVLVTIQAKSVDLVYLASDLAPHTDQVLDLSECPSKETMASTSFPTLQLTLAHTTHLFSPLPQTMVALPLSVVMLLLAALLLMVSLPMVDLSSPQLPTLLAPHSAMIPLQAPLLSLRPLTVVPLGSRLVSAVLLPVSPTSLALALLLRATMPLQLLVSSEAAQSLTMALASRPLHCLSMDLDLDLEKANLLRKSLVLVRDATCSKARELDSVSMLQLALMLSRESVKESLVLESNAESVKERA